VLSAEHFWLHAAKLVRPLLQIRCSLPAFSVFSSAFLYNWAMAKNLASNRYLRDRATRDRLVLKSVASSSAIEGIRAPFQKTRGGVTTISGSASSKKR
jgi:hypothetical protein